MDETHLRMMLSCLRGIEVVSIQEEAEIYETEEQTAKEQFITAVHTASDLVLEEWLEMKENKLIIMKDSQFAQVLIDETDNAIKIIKYEQEHRKPACQTPPPLGLTVDGFKYFKLITLNTDGGWDVVDFYKTEKEALDAGKDLENTWDVKDIRNA
jgi:hypothetical protein